MLKLLLVNSQNKRAIEIPLSILIKTFYQNNCFSTDFHLLCSWIPKNIFNCVSTASTAFSTASFLKIQLLFYNCLRAVEKQSEHFKNSSWNVVEIVTQLLFIWNVTGIRLLLQLLQCCGIREIVKVICEISSQKQLKMS